MVQFKIDNASANAIAKEKLVARIAAEKAAIASKGKERGEDTQGNGEETAHGSPSNTVIS